MFREVVGSVVLVYHSYCYLLLETLPTSARACNNIQQSPSESQAWILSNKVNETMVWCWKYWFTLDVDEREFHKNGHAST